MRTLTQSSLDATFFPLTPGQLSQLNGICRLARWLDGKDAIPAGSSNMSLRVNHQSFLISKSGFHKRSLQPHHFVRCDLESKPLHPVAPKPSDETQLHAMVYRHDPHAQVIIHCHFPSFDKAKVWDLELTDHELLKALGCATHDTKCQISVYPNSQNMTQLSQEISEDFFLRKNPTEFHCNFAFFLENHGIYIWGKNLTEVQNRLEAVMYFLGNL